MTLLIFRTAALCMGVVLLSGWRTERHSAVVMGVMLLSLYTALGRPR